MSGVVFRGGSCKKKKKENKHGAGFTLARAHGERSLVFFYLTTFVQIATNLEEAISDDTPVRASHL